VRVTKRPPALEDREDHKRAADKQRSKPEYAPHDATARAAPARRLSESLADDGNGRARVRFTHSFSIHVFSTLRKSGSARRQSAIAGLERIAFVWLTGGRVCRSLARRRLGVSWRRPSRVTICDQAWQVVPNEDADAAVVVHASRPTTGSHSIPARRFCSNLRRGTDGVRFGYDDPSGTGHAERITFSVAPAALQPSKTLDLAFAPKYNVTHAADPMARVVIQNAQFFGHHRASALVIPAV
jgi:hypothetical protein